MAIATISLTSAFSQEEKKTSSETVEQATINDITFGVRGNCGMCKRTIEKAANSVDGVTKAFWDVEKKKIDVSFDASKTNELAIHEAIAASGYDTDKAQGDTKVYDNLPGCCQYDHQMKMKQLD